MSVEIKELNVISTIKNSSNLEQASIIETEKIIHRILKESELKIKKKEQIEYDR
ncbi:MAG: hypothetical protein JW915_21330 [Chitinispirillaceae bacterium]|nr:hypothetical protein [Chitinispirillaceae bacterium]